MSKVESTESNKLIIQFGSYNPLPKRGHGVM